MYHHFQNLKKADRTKDLVNFRWWIGEKPQFNGQFCIPCKIATGIHVDLCENGWQEEAIGFTIMNPLFFLSLGFESRWLYKHLEKITKRRDQKYTNGRSIGFSFSNQSLRIMLWEDPMEWKSTDPKWWKFYIDFGDLFLGRYIYKTETMEEGKTKITMPEGEYDANYKVEKRTWYRSRFPFWKNIRESIDFDIPIGIPEWGKGENSWDCGMDGTFGIATDWLGSVHQASKKIALRCLEMRSKRGSLNDPRYLEWKIEGERKLKERETSHK